MKLKPVSPVLLPGANSCPPPASMAVRCGDIPKSENTNSHEIITSRRNINLNQPYAFTKDKTSNIHTHLHDTESPSYSPTCDSVGDAEEAGRPLARGKRLSVVPISKAHPQQLLPHRFIPQAIDEWVAHRAAERQPRYQSLHPLRHAALTPQGLSAHHPNVWPPGHEEGANHH